MTKDAIPEQPSLLETGVRVPQHVVYRSFPSETVVLNLQTGKYHGLNPTAGEMLAMLEKAECVRDAAAVAAQHYEQPQAKTEQDMCDLCGALLDRDLIEIDGSGAR